jgi:hypothetical protein
LNTTPKLQKIAEQIAALEAQREDSACTRASRAELQAALVAQIDAWHEHAAGRIADDLQRLAAGDDTDRMLMGEPHEYGVPVEHIPQALSHQSMDTRAWLTFAIGKEAMLARFKPLVEEMPLGLDAEARAERMADIERQIVALEVRENALILETEAQGLIVDPRPGQRPHAAILIGFGGENDQ